MLLSFCSKETIEHDLRGHSKRLLRTVLLPSLPDIQAGSYYCRSWGYMRGRHNSRWRGDRVIKSGRGSLPGKDVQDGGAWDRIKKGWACNFWRHLSIIKNERNGVGACWGLLDKLELCISTNRYSIPSSSIL
jgi:hypothetical protein